MSVSIMPGDRVSFFAREFGPDDPETGRAVTLTGTVTRPVWGRARNNVSIRADDGRTFVRLLAGVTRLGTDTDCKTCGHRFSAHSFHGETRSECHDPECECSYYQ